MMLDPSAGDNVLELGPHILKLDSDIHRGSAIADMNFFKQGYPSCNHASSMLFPHRPKYLTDVHSAASPTPPPRFDIVANYLHT